MKGLIKKISVIMLCIAVLLAYGCRKSNDSNTQKKKTVEVITKMKDTTFWQNVIMGAQAAGQEFDVNIISNAPSSENDIYDQIKIVDDAINNKVDAIVLAACDYKELVPVSERAIAKDIPIVIIDSAIDSSKVSSFIATDNKQAGILAGNKLRELVGSKANIAIVSFVKGSAPADQREQGFMQAIGYNPNIKVVAKEYSLSDEKLAEELTKTILEKNKNLDAIAALNGYSAIGVAKAVKELNLSGKVKIVAFDAFPEEIDFMEEGVIQSIVVQNPYSMGYLGVKNAVNALNNKEVPKYIDTGSKVITKSNMYLPENQKLLFPFVE